MKLAQKSAKNQAIVTNFLAEFESFPYREYNEGRRKNRAEQATVARLHEKYYGKNTLPDPVDEAERTLYKSIITSPTEKKKDVGAGERAYLLDRGRKQAWLYSPERQQGFDRSIDVLRQDRDIKNAMGRLRMQEYYSKLNPQQLATLSVREQANATRILGDIEGTNQARELLTSNPDRVQRVQSAYKNLAVMNDTSKNAKVFPPGRNKPLVKQVRSSEYQTERNRKSSLDLFMTTRGKAPYSEIPFDNSLIPEGYQAGTLPEGRKSGLLKQLENNAVAVNKLNPIASTSSNVNESIPLNIPGVSATTTATGKSSVQDKSSNDPILSSVSPAATPKASTKSSGRDFDKEFEFYKKKQEYDAEVKRKAAAARNKERFKRGLLQGGTLLAGGAAIAGGNLILDIYRRKQEEKELERFRKESGMVK